MAYKLFQVGIVPESGHYLTLPDLDEFDKYKCECPNARDACEKVIYLPIQSYLKYKDMMKIVNVIKKS